MSSDSEAESAAESDEALVRRACEGGAEAFHRLIDRHYDRVFRTALGVLRNRAAAEDLTQEVWAGLPRRLRSWRGAARFTTWLHSVTLNAARDALRRDGARARATEAFADVDALDRGAQADSAARLDWLRQALDTLNDDLRETATLVLQEELNHAEAAAILGVAESTVSWRMSEIRKRLRALTTGADAPRERDARVPSPADGSEA